MRPFCKRQEGRDEESDEESDEDGPDKSKESERQLRTLRIDEPVRLFGCRAKDKSYNKNKCMRYEGELGEQEDEWDVPGNPSTDSEVPPLILDDLADDKEDPTLEDWTHNEGRFRKTTYQRGKSLYTKRDMAEPMEKGERVEQTIRSGDEMPALVKILGKRGSYEKEKTYPSMTGDEIREVVAWNDQQPENQGGGKTFLIHRMAQGTTTLTEVADKKREGGGRMKRGMRVSGPLYPVLST